MEPGSIKVNTQLCGIVHMVQRKPKEFTIFDNFAQTLVTLFAYENCTDCAVEKQIF